MAMKPFPDYGEFWPPLSQDTVLREQERRTNAKTAYEAPDQVEGLSVTLDTRTINDGATNRNFNYLSIVWSVPVRRNYHHARVLIKGYATDQELTTYDTSGSLSWWVAAEVSDSPVNLYLEYTAEDIVIGVQAFNKEGVGTNVDRMPMTKLTLN